jgi:hypothetical protein
MKSILNLFFAVAVLASPVIAAEDAAYCNQKCTPEHCSKYPLRAGNCKTDCPEMFDACYAALSDAQKKIADQVIKAVEAAQANQAAAPAA